MKSHLSVLKKLVSILILLALCNPALAADSNTAGVKAPSPTFVAGTEPNTTAGAKSDIAVTVNEFVITESQLETAVKPQLERMSNRGSKMPPAILKQLKSQIRRKTLEALVAERLLDEQIEKQGIVVTEQDVINHLKEAGAQQNPPLSLQDIKAMIEGRGRNFDQMVQQMKTSKRMKYQKLIDAQFAGKLNFTEQDAQNYYSEHKDQFRKSELVRARHILIRPVKSDPNIDPNAAKAKAKEKVEKLLKQIKEESADFAALAKANSDCPSAKSGGDLGYFPRGNMVPAFDKVAFELKPGQVSDIVETRFGYHIIRVDDHKEPTVTTFEQAKDDIIKRLKQEKQGELAQKYIDSLKDKANIVYPPGKEPGPAAPYITDVRPATPPKKKQ